MRANDFDIPVQNLKPEGKFALFEMLKYKPHRGQRKIHRCDSPFRVVAAASRLGKSTAAGFEASAYAHLHNKMIWCVGPTYDLAEKVFRIVWKVLLEELKYDAIHASYRERVIKLPWGTEVHGKSANNPDSLLGEGVDFMVVDEAARINREVWEEYLLMRLLDKAGMALIISSTKGTEGWFPELYRRGKDKRHPDWWSTRCPLTDNTYIPNLEREIERLRREMSEEAFNQEVMGLFVPFGGLVYKEWREDRHVNKSAVFNPELPIILATDYGTRNPCAVQFWQRTGEKLFHCFDEYYVAGCDTVDHARAVRSQLRGYTKYCKHKTVDMYHDPAGLDETMIFKKFIPELRPFAGVNDIEPGINTVRSHLKYDDEKSRPHILFHPRCAMTREEFATYHYARAKEGRISGVSEKPVDVDNHAVAATRYLLHTLVPASSPTGLFDLIDCGFSDPYLGVQEVGYDYYEEIDRIKSTIYPAEEEDPYSS